MVYHGVLSFSLAYAHQVVTLGLAKQWYTPLYSPVRVQDQRP